MTQGGGFVYQQSRIYLLDLKAGDFAIDNQATEVNTCFYLKT
jgi:hypothetical protein